ncbi:MAG: hypothetical protein GZ091_07605 [Paludibacter sp.]|nr:hypothetical protein [Paludibacter sp.]
MKYLFLVLTFLHGVIHLMGFAKAFNYAKLEQLTLPISKTSGIFWLITFILFLSTVIAYLAKSNSWSVLAFAAVLLSTILIIMVWKDAKFGMIPNVIILVVAVIGFATARFENSYKADVKVGLEQTDSIRESVLTEADLVDLPEPVKNYIRYTGSVGKPKVNNFRLEFVGKIRKDEQSEWMPFTTEQYNFIDTSKRLFFMKATMKGLPVAGYHCFDNGNAFMDIRLLSLVRVQYAEGKEMNIAETVTFFNDMCCMAPATLIDKRIKWMETNENTVKCSFTNAGITIGATLLFHENGELTNFISNDRFAAQENGIMQQIPWSTPLKDYKLINGFKLASYADLIYDYPNGKFCYGTFSLKGIEYNCH